MTHHSSLILHHSSLITFKCYTGAVEEDNGFRIDHHRNLDGRVFAAACEHF